MAYRSGKTDPHSRVVRCLLTAVVLWAGATGPWARAQAQAAKPNFVFILSDDHSAPYVGCYGYPIRTPCLDRLAADGMRFDWAFTAAPQCVQSRSALMTGRSPVANRMGRFTAPLPPDIVTLPELLRDQAGYYTGICRRIFHLDGNPKNIGPVGDIMDKHQMRTFAKRVNYLDSSGPGQTNARVKEFLDQVPKGSPFFLWVNLNDPHHGWDKNSVSPMPDPNKMVLPPHLPNLPGVRQDLALYCGEIERLDKEVAGILEILEQRDLSGKTIVAFMGDNGMALPHGKGSLYDPGLHVPLIVRWPGVVKGKSSCQELISGEDITPTFLEAAGLSVPKSMTGWSFLKALKAEPFQGRPYIFGMRGVHGTATFTDSTPSSGYDLARCVRSKQYKLILNYTPWMRYQPVDSASDPGWTQIVAAHNAGTLAPDLDRTYFTSPRPIVELYDLRKDPSELRNLAGTPACAEVERELKLALLEQMVVNYDFLPLPAVEDSSSGAARKKTKG